VQSTARLGRAEQEPVEPVGRGSSCRSRRKGKRGYEHGEEANEHGVEDVVGMRVCAAPPSDEGELI
jgi:hypothetical protein